MGRNAPFLPRPRRSTRIEHEKTAALTSGADGPVTAIDSPSTAPLSDRPAALPDDVATVYGWLCRITPHPAEVEDLLIEVVGRSREAAPACLRAASDTTRLQFLTIQSVLRWRGVL
jgi:hypothetical protein